jgi:hypothetical protein
MKFDQFIEKANEFLREVAIELGTPDDTDHAYRVMNDFGFSHYQGNIVNGGIFTSHFTAAHDLERRVC